jgi:hypothetical protein
MLKYGPQYSKEAPVKDIVFIKELYNYKNDDKSIAETALKQIY